MQCWNCGFENVPDAPACGRCASRLNLDGVSVEPPRADGLHTATHVRRVGHRLRAVANELGVVWRKVRVVVPEPLDSRALAWSFIPGLGHLKTDRRPRGRLLLSMWLIVLALAIVGAATPWAPYLLGGLVAIHSFAIVSLFAANLAYESLAMRGAFGLLVYLGLNFFAYLPVIWFCSGFLVVLRITGAPLGAAVETGDGLLCVGRWLQPAAFAIGDVVLYRIEGMQEEGLIIQPGINVDRVMGCPGDRIQYEGGTLLVNGAPPEEGARPLGRLPSFGAFDVQLGPHEYAIFTSIQARNPYAHLPRNRHWPDHVVRHLTVVARDDILERVMVRVYPLSRFGRGR